MLITNYQNKSYKRSLENQLIAFSQEERISNFFSEKLKEMKAGASNSNRDELIIKHNKQYSLKLLKNIISNVLIKAAKQQNDCDVSQIKNTLKLIIKSMQESINHGGNSYFYDGYHYGKITNENAVAVFTDFLEARDAKSLLENICVHRNTFFNGRKFSFYKTNYTKTAQELIQYIENFTLNFAILNEKELRKYECPNFHVLKENGYKCLIAQNKLRSDRPLYVIQENVTHIESALYFKSSQTESLPFLKYMYDIPHKNFETIWHNVIHHIVLAENLTAVYDFEKNVLNIYITNFLDKDNKKKILLDKINEGVSKSKCKATFTGVEVIVRHGFDSSIFEDSAAS